VLSSEPRETGFPIRLKGDWEFHGTHYSPHSQIIEAARDSLSSVKSDTEDQSIPRSAIVGTDFKFTVKLFGQDMNQVHSKCMIFI
jgi:hypothetical protein